MKSLAANQKVFEIDPGGVIGALGERLDFSEQRHVFESSVQYPVNSNQ
jgi:hypothetical protein